MPGVTMPDSRPSDLGVPPFQLIKPVFFIGFMGAGKTSVARRIARTCHVVSIDMDTYLERRTGKQIKDIFAQSGESAFRTLESEVLQDLAEGEPHLISCGGGVVVKPENREVLQAKGYVVYLKVSADEALERIGDTSSRPLFQDIENARKINQERAALYEEVADLSVDTTGKRRIEIAEDVQKALIKEGILCRLPK